MVDSSSSTTTVAEAPPRKHVSVPGGDAYPLALAHLNKNFKKTSPEYWVSKRILAWQNLHSIMNVTGNASHASWVELFGEQVRAELIAGEQKSEND